MSETEAILNDSRCQRPANGGLSDSGHVFAKQSGNCSPTGDPTSDKSTHRSARSARAASTVTFSQTRASFKMPKTRQVRKREGELLWRLLTGLYVCALIKTS